MSGESSVKYSLSDLKDLASVSPRTVRYYIAEGLLPPPVVAGSRSYYTQGHLDRLRLIGHLKSNYLPLREIRKRMAGMDDAEVSQAVAELGETIATSGHAVYDRDTAQDYLARVMKDAPDAEVQVNFSSVDAYPLDWEPAPARMVKPLRRPISRPLASVDEGSSWRRIVLGEDVELMVREEAFERHRDRIEWLQDWARKVFS